jgi:hypothetical protein
MNDLTTATANVKSFWERKEGAVGVGTLALIGGIAFLTLNAFLPTLLGFFTMGVAVLGKMWMMAILAGSLYFAGLLLFGGGPFKKIRVLISYMFKTAIRHFTNFFVAIFPIDIMKNYVERLSEKLEEFVAQLAKLNGQMVACKRQIDENTTGIKDNQARFIAAKQHNPPMAAAIQLAANNIDRLTKSNGRLQPLLDRMQVLAKILTKYKEASEFLIQDTQAEVKMRESESKAVNAAHSAMKAAQSILSGIPSEKELFDQACEFQADDVSKKYGEIDEFMSGSKGIIDNLDLQNETAVEKALAQFEEWGKNADSLVLGGEKRVLLENLSLQPGILQAIPVSTTADGGYDKFFAETK